jgi:tetratricopeptide (TPR) repeat protein
MSNILQSHGRIAYLRGDYEQAYASLQESVAIDEEFGIRMNYLWTHTHLGYLAVYRGKIDEAREIFARTARDFFDDKSEIGVVFTLEGMASLFVEVGKAEIAAKLIGWADVTRKQIDDTRSHLEQMSVEKIISACIGKMGEVAFSDAYDEGQKITLEEAVSYALSEY